MQSKRAEKEKEKEMAKAKKVFYYLFIFFISMWKIILIRIYINLYYLLKLYEGIVKK